MNIYKQKMSVGSFRPYRIVIDVETSEEDLELCRSFRYVRISLDKYFDRYIDIMPEHEKYKAIELIRSLETVINEKI